jgi:hypothetical protein
MDQVKILNAQRIEKWGQKRNKKIALLIRIQGPWQGPIKWIEKLKGIITIVTQFNSILY